MACDDLLVRLSPARALRRVGARVGLMALAAVTLLAGCTQLGETPAGARDEAADERVTVDIGMAIASEVAFGQRVAVALPSGAPSNLAVAWRRAAGDPWTPADRFAVVAGRAILDLPASDVLPGLLEPYAERGVVEVGIFAAGPGGGAAGPPLTQALFTPYGSVVSGEVNLLLRFGGDKAACAAQAEALSGLELAGPPAGSVAAAEGLCFATLRTGARDTAEVVAQLLQLPETLAASRNVVYDLDGGVNAFDPTCGQVVKNLRPVAEHADPQDPSSPGYQPLGPAQLVTSLGADDAWAQGVTGNGVIIALLGGGVHRPALSRPGQLARGFNFIAPGRPPSERFGCDFDEDGNPDLLGHDTHTAELITLLAPGAQVVPLKVCTNAGSCPSGKAVVALLELLGRTAGNALVSMSFGGPLPDPTMTALLRFDDSQPSGRLTVFASAGNFPLAASHYPAALSQGVAGNGLENVLSVGATGLLDSGGWLEAAFNTAATTEFLAPGIELCPASAAAFACSAGSPGGLVGSSYATPLAVGLAALYGEASGSLAAGQLRTCLANTSADGSRSIFVPSGC